MKTTAVEATSDNQPPMIPFRFKDEEQVPSEAWEFFDSQRLTDEDLEVLARLDDLKRKGYREPHEV